MASPIVIVTWPYALWAGKDVGTVTPTVRKFAAALGPITMYTGAQISAAYGNTTSLGWLYLGAGAAVYAYLQTQQ